LEKFAPDQRIIGLGALINYTYPNETGMRCERSQGGTVMDWFTEISIFPMLVPQLMSVKIVEICAVILLILAMLTLIVGWVRHLSPQVRVSALVPLAAGLAATIAAHALHDSYVYWVNFLFNVSGERFPKAYQDQYLRDLATANHTAAVLGWVVVIVTGILLALSFLGMLRLLMPRRRKQLSVPLAIES
jgi:hypothetical protein